MKSTVVIAALALVAGVAIATGSQWLVSGSVNAVATNDGMTGFDANAPLRERIEALEEAVSNERIARQMLEDEVFFLSGELQRYEGPVGAAIVQTSEGDVVAEESRSTRREEYRRRNSRAGRVEALVEAGFLPSQAELIIQREQELQMQSLQARFDAERSGEPLDWSEYRTMTGDTIRTELGDADYERYLEATNRSTRVSVSSVIESSPAQNAGLQPGDEIVRYDGERVFSMTDLTRQTMVGEPGQTVVVDIMRNGNLMQVVMPRGPVGITGGRRRY